MNPILTVGSMAFDSIETPAGKVEKALGGSANYFSLSASFFVPINLVGVVGEDFPEEHINTLETRGIDVAGLQKVPGKTFHWTGSYMDDLNEAQTLNTDLNVLESFDPKIPEGYRKSPYVFLGNIDPTLQMKVLDQVEKPKLVALDSMNFWIEGERREDLMSALKKTDIITINEGEAFMLSKKDNLLDAGRTILSFGPKAVVVKQGSYGAFLFHHSGEIFSAPALPIKDVKDPTGAGDTFAGGFMGYLARTDASLESTSQEFRQAVVFGSVMASYNVEDFSFQRLLALEPHEITGRFRSLLEMTTVAPLTHEDEARLFRVRQS
jgi:sugar/nucleoside kinase (ribokinase family)